jgi:hypothetical protein
MLHRMLPLGLLLTVAGCWLDEKPNQLIVQPGPFYPAPDVPQIKQLHAPATEAAATRVEEMKQRILAANPQIGMRPLIVTTGSAQPEIFHRGTGQIVVTEGLINECTTDRFLAAVLCLELGKMVAEREAVASVQSRRPDIEPPPELRIGNETAGTFGSPDGGRMIELARYDKARRRPSDPPPLPPDPQVLARIYLAKSGFHDADLDAAQPILRKAAANFQLERQMTNNQPSAAEALKKQEAEMKKDAK